MIESTSPRRLDKSSACTKKEPLCQPTIRYTAPSRLGPPRLLPQRKRLPTVTKIPLEHPLTQLLKILSETRPHPQAIHSVATQPILSAEAHPLRENPNRLPIRSPMILSVPKARRDDCNRRSQPILTGRLAPIPLQILAEERKLSGNHASSPVITQALR